MGGKFIRPAGSELNTLLELRADAALKDWAVPRKGNRLSITPVESRHWRQILKLLDAGGRGGWSICLLYARNLNKTS